MLASASITLVGEFVFSPYASYKPNPDQTPPAFVTLENDSLDDSSEIENQEQKQFLKR